jgi:hypothetical protein
MRRAEGIADIVDEIVIVVEMSAADVRLRIGG